MAEREGRARARQMASNAGYRMGGHFAKGGETTEDVNADKARVKRAMGQHDTQLHPGHHTKLRLQDGGSASGTMSRGRHDRPSHGRSGHDKAPRINILVNAGRHPADAAGAGAGPMAGPPMPPPRPAPVVAPPGPPRPVGVPMAGGMPMPMGAGPGGPLPPGGIGAAGLPPRPPGMKRGGANRGGEACADGGNTGSGKHDMHAGAGSGIGRLEKIGESPPKDVRAT